MKPSDPRPEAHALAILREEGPLRGYRRLIAENDAMILEPTLDHGSAITRERTAIHTAQIAWWTEQLRQRMGYDRPFAVVAIGGTGRGEMTPCSDLDIAYLFEGRVHGEIEHDPFFKELQIQTLHTNRFREEHGFEMVGSPYGLEDAPELSGKQLNAFLDMAPVHDPDGLADRFRQRLRESCDPFAHFLHVRATWKDQWGVAGEEAERMDRFDIKNDGLRLFLGGVWTLAVEGFRHSAEIYEELDDPGVLDAYAFLLRLRCWLHLRRPPGGQPDHHGNHAEDVMTFADFLSLGEMLGADASERERFDFANEVRARLLSARRRLASFTQGVIERELRVGRRIAPGRPVVFGRGGLAHDPLPPEAEAGERSRAAMTLLLEAQRYAVPVDPSEMQGTFRAARDWLLPTPELARLFQEERGSLARTFEFLSHVDGAMDRLLPGYGGFETSLDERVLAGGVWTRGVMERQKLTDLEKLVREGTDRLTRRIAPSAETLDFAHPHPAIEAARLDPTHLTAVKLALKTKRLPLTPADQAARDDTALPWHERFASGFSGIPLEDYFTGWESSHGFSSAVLETARFLLANRRAFKERAGAGSNPPEKIEEFAGLCGNEHRLRALFVFTCADRARWESPGEDPVRWFNSLELYGKTRRWFQPESAPAARILGGQGHDVEELAVLRDFGPDFYSGNYARHALKFGSRLLQLAGPDPAVKPKADLVYESGSTLLAVAARDWRGLAACISGALWHREVVLRQAHLFSAANHGLALDFFHLQTHDTPLSPDLPQGVEQAILERRHLSEADERALPPLNGTATLTPIRPGEFSLRFESARADGGLVYALCLKVFLHLEANIHGLISHSTAGGVRVSLHLTLPAGLDAEEARRQIAAWC